MDLHPAGSFYSVAYATSGAVQGGLAYVDGKPHAAIWRGTAESFVDANPVGVWHSEIRDAVGDWQVGMADGDAGLWNGSPESFINLHSVLDQSKYWMSRAYGMWTDGRTIKVAGAAWPASGGSHAMLWIITLPDTKRPTIAEASASPNVLWPPNRRLIDFTLNARVEDDSGEADWGVVAIECNEVCPETDRQLVDDRTVRLRATRSGSGDNRIYTIYLQAADTAGNLSDLFPVQVTVPHDMWAGTGYGNQKPVNRRR